MSDARRASWYAYPMHGQDKLIKEGYRTRDGHIIEWLGRLNAKSGPVEVNSRPDPALLAFLSRVRKHRGHLATNTVARTRVSWAVPPLRNRRSWWVRSANSYDYRGVADRPVITWNPFLFTGRGSDVIGTGGQPVVLDLLDDWSIHYAFAAVRSEVEAAYGEAFARATHVFANAPGTLELAHRFGRSDSTLLLNGCDPERFSSVSRADGPITVGYVGKIGKRLDREIIREAIVSLPAVRFVFAGPILDADYRPFLKSFSNVELLGDVHYSDLPSLLETFDVGWVPHRVGEGEVGGDVLKTYEYRAAALPVVSTPVAGAAAHILTNIHVASDVHSRAILNVIKGRARVARIPEQIPEDVTWRYKTAVINSLAIR